MTTEQQPVIKKINVGGREMWEVFSPKGEQIATFYSEHFLTIMMQEMFGLSVFEGLPITEAVNVN